MASRPARSSGRGRRDSGVRRRVSARAAPSPRRPSPDLFVQRSTDPVLRREESNEGDAGGSGLTGIKDIDRGAPVASQSRLIGQERDAHPRDRAEGFSFEYVDAGPDLPTTRAGEADRSVHSKDAPKARSRVRTRPEAPPPEQSGRLRSHSKIFRLRVDDRRSDYLATFPRSAMTLPDSSGWSRFVRRITNVSVRDRAS